MWRALDADLGDRAFILTIIGSHQRFISYEVTWQKLFFRKTLLALSLAVKWNFNTIYTIGFL